MRSLFRKPHTYHNHREGVCIILSQFTLATALLIAINSTLAANSTNNNGNNLFDIDSPPSGKHALTDSWSYGTKLTIENTDERNYDLNLNDHDDFDILVTELEIAFVYVPSANWDAFIDLELSHDSELEDASNRNDEITELNIVELNATWRKPETNFYLKIGRQAYKDNREWLYDEELDAIRSFYRSGKSSFEFSVSGDNLFKRDLLHSTDKKKIYNYFLLADHHTNHDNSYSAYLFIRDDQEEKERPIWLGLRAKANATKQFSYWLESAYVFGKGETDSLGIQQDIDAYGIDIGGTYVFKAAAKPALTIGWAIGSGDSDPTVGGDGNFRQTGLQDNNGRFNGVTRFKYYGEVFEPELSNLEILTLGIGFRFSKKTSLDLIYHSYRQPSISDEIRDSNLQANPLGISNDIGDGLDIVLGYRDIKNLSVECVFSQFNPGAAFGPDQDRAKLVNLKVSYKF